MMLRKKPRYARYRAGMDSAVIFGLLSDSAVIWGMRTGDGGYKSATDTKAWGEP